MALSNALALELAMLLAQDQYLTCNSEHTFFKKRMPRVTNFSIGHLSQVFSGGSGAPLIGSGSGGPKSGPSNHLDVQRVSDLVGPTYLRSQVPALNTQALHGLTGRTATAADINPAGAGAVNPVSTVDPDLNSPEEGWALVDAAAFFMVQRAQLNIGGHMVDEIRAEQQYQEWCRTRPDELRLEEALGIGVAEDRVTRAHREQVFYTPLMFYYTTAACLYLPVIGLPAHVIQIQFEGCSAADLWGGVGGTAHTQPTPAQIADVEAALRTTKQELMYEGVFLDKMERMQHATVNQQYVVLENQFQESKDIGEGQQEIQLQLNLNHPVATMTVALRPTRFVEPESAFVLLEHDKIQPVKRGRGGAGEFKTPIQWNDFSNGQALAGSAERLSPIQHMQLQFNNYNRLPENQLNSGALFSEVSNEAHGFKGRSHECFAQTISFCLDGQTTTQYTGSANLSAADSVTLTIRRNPAPASHYTGGGASYLAKYNDPFPKVSLFVHAKSWNVVNIASGMFAKSFAN